MSVWLPAAVSIAGALLAFVGARIGVRAEWASITQRDEQSRREEWGRRFSLALQLIVETDGQRGELGRILLDELSASPLATDSDRDLAAKMLSLSAADRARRELDSLDDVGFAGDNGDDGQRGDR